jgi:hypothetical protein
MLFCQYVGVKLMVKYVISELRPKLLIISEIDFRTPSLFWTYVQKHPVTAVFRSLEGLLTRLRSALVNYDFPMPIASFSRLGLSAS